MVKEVVDVEVEEVGGGRLVEVVPLAAVVVLGESLLIAIVSGRLGLVRSVESFGNQASSRC